MLSSVNQVLFYPARTTASSENELEWGRNEGRKEERRIPKYVRGNPIE